MLDSADFGEPSGLPIGLVPVAGLQFYEWMRRDPVSGRIMPTYCQRLELVREPNNRADPNAIRVLCNNGSAMLGHIPRDIAEDLAPVMDRGTIIRAYVAHPGNGETWSLKVALISEALPETLRASFDVRSRFWQEVDEAERAALSRNVATGPRLVDLFDERQKRRRDAACALALLLVTDDDMRCPEPERGVSDAPRTRGEWAELGYSVPKKAIPVKTERRWGAGFWSQCGLFGLDQVRPKRPLTLRQIAARLARELD